MRALFFLAAILFVAVGFGQTVPASNVLNVRERSAALLATPQILTELKVTDAQRDQLRSEFARAASRRKAAYAFQEIDEKKVIESEKQSSAALLAVLKPDQLTRLVELGRQRVGTRALADPEVAKELNLSDDVRAKIQQMYADCDTKFEDIDAAIGELLGGSAAAVGDEAKKADDARRKRIIESFELERIEARKALKLADKASLELLTEDQKSKWTKVLGKPYKFM